MKKRTFQIIILLSFLTLFATFSYRLLDLPLWDYDFWWHIATGRYIMETGSVPDHDPFSFTSELSENKNLFPRFEALVLKNYWLAQIIFYQVYRIFGDAGMILLRSFLLISVLLIVCWQLARDHVKFYLVFILVFFLSVSLSSFTGERPVLFSLLLATLVFILLDNFRKTRTKKILLLVPLMLLWANLHAGFMIGIIIIGTFMAGETLDIFFRRTLYSKEDSILFYAATSTAILTTGINPNGYDTLLYSLSPDFRMLIQGSQEYQSVFLLYFNKIRSIDFEYIILLFLSAMVLVVRGRKMGLSSILLLLTLSFMSVYALRFLAFYSVIGTLLIGKEIDRLIDRLFEGRMNENFQRLLPQVLAVLILISSSIFFMSVVKFKWLEFEKAVTRSVPQGAIDFIEKNRIEGNIFNDFGFGGYLTWRLYPWKKDFVDTRWLNNTVKSEYEWVYKTVDSIRSKTLPEGKVPLWKRILDHYHINIIFLDTLGIQGGIPPLLLKVMEEEEWAPVYADLISAVFVRDREENRDLIQRFRVPKETLYNLLMVRAINRAVATDSPAYYKDLGDIFIARGMTKEAVTAYEYAAKKLPRFHPERLRIEELGEKWSQEETPPAIQEIRERQGAP